ncbi:MAG: hypothetical protein QOE39_2846 [Bradyrhizobium sp.]|jgi:hypothetical protein|nr:hypothetical protein [Bradyrhizobium sp.]
MAAFPGSRTPLKSGIDAAVARRRSPDWIMWPALAMALAAGIVLAPGPARPQTGVALLKVDLSVVMQGYRPSKVIGSNVINDKERKVTLPGATKDELKKLSEFNYPA